MKNVFSLLCVMMFSATGFSQNKIIDSLNAMVNTGSGDSVKAIALTDLGGNYFGYDSIKSIQALEKATAILKRNNWAYNWGYFYQIKAMIEAYRGKFEYSLLLKDTALLFYKKAMPIQDKAAQKNTLFQIAILTADKGSTYASMHDNEMAIKFYLDGLSLYEKTDDPARMEKMGTCYNNLATLYYTIGQFEKGLEYDVLAIPFHLAAGNDETIALAYIFAADDFSSLKKFDSAKAYFDRATPFVKKLNMPSLNIEYYGKTGSSYSNQKNWQKAVENYTIAYRNAKQIGNIFYQASYLRGLADASYYGGNQEEAEAYGLKGLEIIEAHNLIDEKMRLYKILSYIYKKKKDYSNAYKYLQLYTNIKQKSNDEELKKKIYELDTKYQSEIRAKEIIQLQKDKLIQSLTIKQKSSLNYFLIASLAASLLIGFLGYRNFRNRHLLVKKEFELQQKQISELAKDRQLIAVDSMLKGQEDERSRLAKDLHDGLGGLLSGVKFSLSNMKDNLIITPDNMAVFERSLDMLDTSIKELRRVAHNMMPEILTQFGLDEALKEYCNTINTTKLLTVRYQSFGMDTRLDNSAEIVIYRIIQELLNNTMKHAAASEVFVQLIREGNRLSIVVEDNGKGFDPSLAENNKGAGLTSIRSRVDYLKGQLDIHSEPGKGTLINIEFNV
ncbi:MAG TPA: sensor histidine kinase [Chitinophagaceae bacterium]|nr:sensor histidine kinase [Chitinophagaceae bacterium]